MPPILELQNLSKTFTSQVALDAVDLEIKCGEVHALVGKNGSGKSTLAKILSGFHNPDLGARAFLHGHEISLPMDPEHRRMVHFVHQDLGLVNSLSILDNIGLSDGFRTHGLHRIDWKHSRVRARRALAPFGLDQLDLNVPISRLTSSERAVTAIARGLLGWEEQAGLLVLDETTASLPPKEVHILEAAMNQVTSQGAGILYISHRLDEVFAFADRVSVLRDGRKVGTYATDDISQEELVTKMIGKTSYEFEPLSEPTDRIVLQCRSLTADGLQGLDLTVCAGEIVGVAGILGSGREHVADVLFGALPLESGEIFINGQSVKRLSPHNSLEKGVVLVPSDRMRRGILQQLTVRENITLPRLGPLRSKGLIRRNVEAAEVRRWIKSVELSPPEPERPVGTLSGGNQQKAVIARALRMNPQVLILDEATQGVDIGAKRGIHNLIRKAARQGSAVIICTAEPEDLPNLCHRVMVIHNGSFVNELHGASLTQENIYQSCN